MNAPITMSSTYVHDATLEYGRDGNAGWGALEAALGALDGGRAVTFASGLAAATAIADLVPAGRDRGALDRHVLRRQEHLRADAGDWAPRTLRMAPADDTAAVLAAADGADMVWVESIANPLMVVADVPAIAAGARERGAITVVDATFATPLRQRPLDLGADIVLHSATKLIGGHSDLLLGAAVCRDPAHADVLATYRHDHGAIPGASRPSSRCAACGRSPSGWTGPRRRRPSSPAAWRRTRTSRRSTTRACPATRSTNAPRACCRTGRGPCCRSRSPGPSSRPRRSWRGCGS